MLTLKLEEIRGELLRRLLVPPPPPPTLGLEGAELAMPGELAWLFFLQGQVGVSQRAHTRNSCKNYEEIG
jgi:hypothetical protein